MRLNNFARYGQAQTATVAAARTSAIDLIEALEHALGLLGPNV